MTISEFRHLLELVAVRGPHVKQVHRHSFIEDVRFLCSKLVRAWGGEICLFGWRNQVILVALFHNHLWNDLKSFSNNLDAGRPIYPLKNLLVFYEEFHVYELLRALNFLIEVVINVDLLGLELLVF
jgi:hypothetical protein